MDITTKDKYLAAKARMIAVEECGRSSRYVTTLLAQLEWLYECWHHGLQFEPQNAGYPEKYATQISVIHKGICNGS